MRMIRIRIRNQWRGFADRIRANTLRIGNISKLYASVSGEKSEILDAVWCDIKFAIFLFVSWLLERQSVKEIRSKVMARILFLVSVTTSLCQLNQ
jgi:hypothetical protein